MAMRERLYIRASSDELETWKRKADAAGARSLSSFVRDRLEEAPVPAAPEEKDWLAEMRRIAASE